MASDTSWVKPGADIAIYVSGREGAHGLRLRKVLKVAAQSFTVEGIEERFKFDQMRSKSIGGTWKSWHYVAVHPDSAQAAKVAARDRRDRLKTRVFPYLHNDVESLEKVDAAIRELQQWRDLLISEQ